MNYELTYENDTGQTVVFGTDSLKVTFFEGFGSLNANVQYQKAPYQDGSTHVDSVFETRPLSLEFVMIASSWDELSEKRRELSRVFNPKNTGKFSLSFGRKTYEIYVNPDSVPYFSQEGANHVQEGIINVTAPNPYWRDPQQVSRALRAYEGKFTFPFTFPVQFGTEGDITTINNEGDTITPVIITIQGPVRRPMIENRTTGEFIQINTAIGPDEVLYIDTNPQAKRVEIHRQDQIIKAMGFFDHNADFWQLQVGENELRYTAEEGIAEAIAAIGWHSQYVGI